MPDLGQNVSREDWDQLVAAVDRFSDACDDYIGSLGHGSLSMQRWRDRLRQARIELEEAMDA